LLNLTNRNFHFKRQRTSTNQNQHCSQWRSPSADGALDAGGRHIGYGETRLRACRELIAEGTRYSQFRYFSEGVQMKTAHYARPHRTPAVNPQQVESGHAFQRLIGHGWTSTDIATK